MLVLVIWAFFVFSSPGEHPRITTEERKYIKASLEGILKDQTEEDKV